MPKRTWMSFKFFVPMLIVSLLAIAVACGESATTAPEATSPPAATDAPTQAPDPTEAPQPSDDDEPATPVPTAVVTEAPAPTAAAPVSTEPHGNLRVAFKEMGSYKGHPWSTSSPTKQYTTMAAFESLLRKDANSEYVGILVEDWSVAEDSVTWTFNLKQGVQFHGGVGEFTSEDVMYSAQQMQRSGYLNGLGWYISYLFPEDGMSTPDKYTLVTDTGSPKWDMPVWLSGPGINGMWIVNKNQTEELVASVGIDAATSQLAGTGPWEYVDSQTGEFWKFRAVEDHYRQTPYFAELTFMEIPVEASVIANFQVGKIDTFVASPGSVSLLAQTPGTKFMTQQGGESSLRLYGQLYLEPAAGEEPLPAYKPDEQPWVSSNTDPNSAEWERARKVREALSIAIDRDSIIEDILYGEGVPLSMWGWGNVQHRQPDHWTWEYDVERAKQLLAEAGYPDGFNITLATAIAGASAEEQACQAVADMWQDIGVKATYLSIPYSNLRGQFRANTYDGATCQNATVYDEPMGVYSYLWEPAYSWSGGVEYPGLNEQQYAAGAIVDRDERWQATLDIGEWVWQNTLDIGLYVQNNVYPLGPALDSWEEHLSTSDSRNISAFEFAPHRR